MAFSYALQKGLGCDFPAAVADLQLSRWTRWGCIRPTSATPCAWHSEGSWGSSSELVLGENNRATIWIGGLDAIALSFAAFL